MRTIGPKTRKASRSAEGQIIDFYNTLLRAWGRQHWWPAQSRFEVIVGAYLTQNTAWTNVERALKELRRAGVLSVAGIRRTAIPALEQLIRSAGYFRQKARNLKNFVEYLDAEYSGSLERMFARPTETLREELLALRGVGPETADSILLYAGNHPVFVVDAYTRRILDRHGILPLTARYEEVRQLFQRALSPASSHELASSTRNSFFTPGRRSGLQVPAAHAPSRISRAKREPAAQIFNEMHGLIVQVGKHYCLKSTAICEQCPLRRFLPETNARE